MKQIAILGIFLIFLTFVQAQIITVPLDVWNNNIMGNLSGGGTTGQVATYITGSATLGAQTVPTCSAGQALTSLGTCSTIGNSTITSTNNRVLWTPLTGSTSVVNASTLRIGDVVANKQICDNLNPWALKYCLNGYINNYLAEGNKIYNITAYYYPYANSSAITTINQSQISQWFDGVYGWYPTDIPPNNTLIVNISWLNALNIGVGNYYGNWRGCWAVNSYYQSPPSGANIYTQRVVSNPGNFSINLEDWVTTERTPDGGTSKLVMGVCSDQLPYSSNFTTLTINSSNTTTPFRPSEITFFAQDLALEAQSSGLTRYSRQLLMHSFFWLGNYSTKIPKTLIGIHVKPDLNEGFLWINRIEPSMYTEVGTSRPNFNFNVNGSAAIDRGTNQSSYFNFLSGTTTGTAVSDGLVIGVTATGKGEIKHQENLNLTLATNNLDGITLVNNGSVVFHRLGGSGTSACLDSNGFLARCTINTTTTTNTVNISVQNIYANASNQIVFGDTSRTQIAKLGKDLNLEASTTTQQGELALGIMSIDASLNALQFNTYYDQTLGYSTYNLNNSQYTAYDIFHDITGDTALHIRGQTALSHGDTYEPYTSGMDVVFNAQAREITNSYDGVSAFRIPLQGANGTTYFDNEGTTKLGINTKNPTSELHVIGSANVTDTIHALSYTANNRAGIGGIVNLIGSDNMPCYLEMEGGLIVGGNCP